MVPWGSTRRASTTPKAYPKELRDDVVAVAQRREPEITINQIVENFGISEACLRNWLRQAEIEAGRRPRTTAAETGELRELRKRNRCRAANRLPGVFALYSINGGQIPW